MERRSFRRWGEARPPRSILVVRLHALGDVAITLPVLAALQRRFPEVSVDYVTTGPARSIPAAVALFREVSTVRYGPGKPLRIASAAMSGLRFRRRAYDVIVDLQRNWFSRTIRTAAAPRAWAEFDRFSPRSAVDRIVDTFDGAGFPALVPVHDLPFDPDVSRRADDMLRSAGWDGRSRLLCVNPAGLWSTRRWPLESYISLASAWLRRPDRQVLLLGTDRIRDARDSITHALGRSVVDCIGRTTPGEAFAAMQRVSLTVSDDSGLMHMSWVAGTPTVALFGSSRHDWSSPVGVHTFCFHSGDLECGACMQSTCRWGDVRCLTRVGPEQVLAAAERLPRWDGRR